MSTSPVPSTTDDLITEVERLLHKRIERKANHSNSGKVQGLLAQRRLIDKALRAAMQEQPT